MFANAEHSLDDVAIETIETRLRLRLPGALRTLYLSSNGGRPDAYMFDSIVVNKFLPLASDRGKQTAVDAYRVLVLGQHLVPRHFFPFAVDPGGDFLFVDCLSPAGDVYIFRHDTDHEQLRSLHVGFDDFWSRLKPE